jgi:hypothetical protein
MAQDVGLGEISDFGLDLQRKTQMRTSSQGTSEVRGTASITATHFQPPTPEELRRYKKDSGRLPYFRR